MTHIMTTNPNTLWRTHPAAVRAALRSCLAANRRSVIKTDTLGRIVQEQYATLQLVSYQYDTR